MVKSFSAITELLLKPFFALSLFLSQLFSTRNSYFSHNLFLISIGVVITISGLIILFKTSIQLKQAREKNKLAARGMYKYIRHPIYSGIYVFTIGLGLIFFEWIYFGVIIVFIPWWYIQARREEQNQISWFGNIYIEYKKIQKCSYLLFFEINCFFLNYSTINIVENATKSCTVPNFKK